MRVGVSLIFTTRLSPSREVRSLPVSADQAVSANKLDAWRAFLQPLYEMEWIVYAKPPFGSPEQVLKYPARLAAIRITGSTWRSHWRYRSQYWL
jgi:hypothetical protein